jgi:hypothetical protein
MTNVMVLAVYTMIGLIRSKDARGVGSLAMAGL